MTLNQLIKSKLSEDSLLGDLARDIQGDEKFPVNGTDKEILSYIHFHTIVRGNNGVVDELKTEYKKHRNKEVPAIDLDIMFSIFRSETWAFYKDHFPIDKIIMVGSLNDFYKVFCVDNSTHRALYFDMKSDISLNDIEIIEEGKIFLGHLTRIVSVKKAIILLTQCEYPDDSLPNENTMKELLSYLSQHNTK